MCCHRIDWDPLNFHVKTTIPKLKPDSPPLVQSHNDDMAANEDAPVKVSLKYIG